MWNPVILHHHRFCQCRGEGKQSKLLCWISPRPLTRSTMTNSLPNCGTVEWMGSFTNGSRPGYTTASSVWLLAEQSQRSVKLQVEFHKAVYFGCSSSSIYMTLSTAWIATSDSLQMTLFSIEQSTPKMTTSCCNKTEMRCVHGPTVGAWNSKPTNATPFT